MSGGQDEASNDIESSGGKLPVGLREIDMTEAATKQIKDMLAAGAALQGDRMKDIDIIRNCLPATEQLLEGTEVDLYEFDAVRLEQAAKLIRERLEAENIAALETMEDELNDHMERFGI